ncbi:hypothetical protein SH591_00695 [Sphingomonas sp. LY54]|uniref:hypothetical protein n=1 Tax=Sphingomonas sp. LY54 TaxID=3095343 RepID=UPI002D770B4F|nr:hypothetical protein [Sphingomonas sp. LY54]WRP28741.1 hypothetical protein SH591_00695 [Sphingomonas sp. LY54]
MRRKKTDAPPLDAIEKDFRAALARLMSGDPTHKELKALQKTGNLKVNFTTVAQEAKRSRTLIALKECRYPATRQLILQAMEERPSSPRTSSELIEKLRSDLASERVLKHNAQAEALAHYHHRSSAEQEARRWKKAHDRLLAKSAAERRENVVPFRDPS